MTWLPLADSGVAHEATLVGQTSVQFGQFVYAGLVAVGNGFSVTFPQPQRVYISVSMTATGATGALGDATFGRASGPPVTISGTVGPQGTWVPNVIEESQVTSLAFTANAPGAGFISFAVGVYVWTGDGEPEPEPEPEPWAPNGRITVQQRSYQAVRGSDVALQCWLRDESGPLDASGMDLLVEAVAYGQRHVRAGWPGTGDADGRVSFVVPNGHKLDAGLYQLRIRSEQFGPVVSLGLLEVV